MEVKYEKDWSETTSYIAENMTIIMIWPNYLTFDLQNLQANVWYQASYVVQV